MRTVLFLVIAALDPPQFNGSTILYPKSNAFQTGSHRSRIFAPLLQPSLPVSFINIGRPSMAVVVERPPDPGISSSLTQLDAIYARSSSRVASRGRTDRMCSR